MSALFILKQNTSYGGYDYTATPSTPSTTNLQAASGMWNSAKMVVDFLQSLGVSAQAEIVFDGNAIDGRVTELNPDVVFIEGLWASPTKMNELLQIPRHQPRQWIVRIHSDLPFLATEGVAFSWIKQYIDLGVKVAPNSQRLYRELKVLFKMMGYSDEAISEYLIYLPNCYPTDFPAIQPMDLQNKDTLDIACFGAVRVLKNHVMQAFIAMEFAKKNNKKLRWHFNDRVGSGGQGPYNNMIALMSNIPDVELVPHEWESRDDFMESLSEIDILMQLSMSETMNIVAADATFAGKPILVSSEISWAHPLFGDVNNSEENLSILQMIFNRPSMFVQLNREGLRSYAQSSEYIWARFFISVSEPINVLSSPSIIPQTINCCGN
jgi:hypothetical protein